MDSNIIVKEVTLSLTISFQLGNIIVQLIKSVYQNECVAITLLLLYRVITEDASTFSCLSKDLDFPSPLGTVDALYTSKFSLMDYLEDK